VPGFSFAAKLGPAPGKLTDIGGFLEFKNAELTAKKNRVR
jgi:hypothetical protein